MSGLLEISPYESDEGAFVGRDPRKLTPADFSAADVPLRPVLKAIRANCLDCCGGNAAEVRKCVSVRCPLWPMRMGRFPSALRKALRDVPDETEGDEEAPQ